MSSIRDDLRFNDPVLNELSFKINKDFDKDTFEGLDNLKYDLTFKDTTVENSNEDKDENTTVVVFTLRVGDEGASYPFSFLIEYEAEFFWSKISGIEEESFLRINAASILYSYCRPIVHNITGLSEFPSLNLPFYNFTTD
ncbi:hypothetical protein AXY40_08945 [Staphylococcus saprophyticus]|uniref:protein-export chaperone SecB n=1 Tax=Staphylococcus TaxID=1279 RepID=UPI0007D90366|nr:protein-export chaperone SecB [Staphylococcus saprophyticus]OAO32737.1 hypothetical protein AXY40_08945 [Staphylococcus saprophyticus]OAO33902.1 hypothetical protein AXY41_10655 [Staphylococcus saprophyticus]